MRCGGKDDMRLALAEFATAIGFEFTDDEKKSACAREQNICSTVIAPWKTVRVFISSTFRDMQAERDWLVRFVFPRLREELLKWRIHFVDVDLRWGVTSDQNALGVCRAVIDECHPRFMCMLGGRYGWVPDGQDKSITADEIHYGVLGREAGKRGHSFFYFRDDRATARMVEETPGDFREPDGSDGAQKLAALKQSVTGAGLPVFLYDAQWDGAQKRLVGLEKFGERVHADLLQSLRNDPELAARFATDGTAPPDEFAEEAEQMDAFIEERTEQFILGSREPLMRGLLAFASADGTPNIYVLTGAPGSGKSAFLAKFTREISKSPVTSHQSPLLLPHFIGASTGSTDLRRTLRRLCHDLALAACNTEPLPLDIKELITHFQKLLGEAAGRQRVILVLDALNQFDATDGAHWLNWLPRELPPGVRIVASVIAPADGQPEHQTLAILRHRPGTRMEKLAPLTEADTLAIIEGSLRRYAKRLNPGQLAALLAKPAGRLPLYVLTALEELRTLGTYDEITDRIRELPGDARALFGWILKRLSADPIFGRAEEAKRLVEKFAACLGVSRHGLSPAELAALLDPGDPLGNVAALLRLLRPYLMRRGELLDFYHSQFREAGTSMFEKEAKKSSSAHLALAQYFLHVADPSRDSSFTGSDSRALEELPHHLTHAGDSSALHEVLCNVSFLDAVFIAGVAFPFLQDLEAARAAWSSDVLRSIGNAVASSLKTITSHPRFGLAAFVNRLRWEGGVDERIKSTVTRASIKLDSKGPWFETASPFEGEGSLVFGSSQPLQALCANRGLLVTSDGRHGMEFRDIQRGNLLARRGLGEAGAHCLAVEPSQSLVAWAQRDGQIHSENSGNVLAGRPCELIIAFPTPSTVIAVRRDGSLVAWEPQSGVESVLYARLPFPLLVLRGVHGSDALLAVAGESTGAQAIFTLSATDGVWRSSPIAWAGSPVLDGCLVPGGEHALFVCADRTMSIVQIPSGSVLASTAYERRADASAIGRPEACAAGFYSDKPAIMLATSDGCLLAWHWQDDTAENLTAYKTRFDNISAVTLEYLPVQKAFFLTTQDRGILLTARASRTSHRHRAPVASCALTASGCVASVCREDHTLRWWQFEGLLPLRKFDVELPQIVSAAADDESVFVGTGTGWLWRHPSDASPPDGHVFKLFDHPVSGLFATSARQAVAASSEGQILSVDFQDDSVAWLCSDIGMRRQAAVFPCPVPGGIYLSVRELSAGDRCHTLAMGGKGKEETELYQHFQPFMAAVSEAAVRIAIVGKHTTVCSLEEATLNSLFHGDVGPDAVALEFARNGTLLILARDDENWLELRCCEATLPLVGILELPSEPSCLCVRGNQIVVGFRSGRLMAIRLRG